MALWPLRSDQPDLIARVALSQTLEQAPQIVSYTIGRLVTDYNCTRSTRPGPSGRRGFG
jgi:hypothetical protein